jgi:gamma-glutamylaminecyclotransferase
MRHLVAVYGSLKQGFGNHRLLEKANFIGSGETPPIYEMRGEGRGYPGIFKGDSRVQVEVYSVTHEELKNLDSLEGHPNFYRREVTDILLDSGEKLPAFIYKLSESYDMGAVVSAIDEKGRQTWTKPQRYY